MPALNIDIDALEDKGFIKLLSGNDYLTVSGRLYLAHSSGQLIGIETEEMYPDDPDFLTIKATATIINGVTLGQAERIAALPADKMSDEVKLFTVRELLQTALISEYTGMAQSKRKGGKSAEGTNPREVAETSAVGRALGNAGFGDTESFASFEEMMVAMSRDGREPEPEVKTPTKAAPKKQAPKKAANPNAPTATQKETLYNLAVAKLGVTNKADFAAKIEAREESGGKKLTEFTSADVERLTDALMLIPPF